MPLRSVLVPLALAPILVGIASAAPAPALPPVAMSLAWAPRSTGRVALRDDIARVSLDALSAKGCFPEALAAEDAPEGALRLDVELDDLREEILYDDTLAEHADTGRPGASLRVTAVFSVEIRWSLHAPGGERPIASKHFKIERQRRPVMDGEDPAAYARDEAIEAIGRELARAVCGVPRKRIDAALRGDEPR